MNFSRSDPQASPQLDDIRMIEIVSAFIAIIAAVIAFHQRSLSEHTLRAQLLDRKLKIYESIEEMVSQAKFHGGDLDQEAVWYFKRNTQKMQFLFSKRTNQLFLKLIECFDLLVSYQTHEDGFPGGVDADAELKKSRDWMDEAFKNLETSMVKEMKVLVNPWKIW